VGYPSALNLASRTPVGGGVVENISDEGMTKRGNTAGFWATAKEIFLKAT
jgi:hypothetical protein